MSRILVSGLVNVETTVKVKEFPLNYSPIEFSSFGVSSGVSGVGYNLGKAFSSLGDEIKVASIIGNDMFEKVICDEFLGAELDTDYLMKGLDETPQSVIIYETSGRRQCHCDLKDIQDKSYMNPNLKLDEYDLICACNINFSRSLLKEAKSKGITIATDVHVLSNIEDPYNSEFMEAADVLFLSDENIIGEAKDFITMLQHRYQKKVIIMGQGKKGALMYVSKDDCFYQIDSVTTREVINTVGAGDALFSSFLHYYVKGYSEIDSLKRAVTFASYKIGESGGAKGFLSECELDKLCEGLSYHITTIQQ
jgi:ribokinase